MDQKKSRALVEAGGREEGLEVGEAQETPASLVATALKVGGLTALGIAGLLVIGGANQVAKGVPPPGPLHEGLFFIGIAALITWALVSWLVGLIMVLSKGREALLGARPELPPTTEEADP
jgi:hypothetical protein